MTSRRDELGRIRLLRERLGDPPAHVLVAIGDDAAVLAAPPGELLVWTVDAAVEHVHFRRELASWTDIGARATAAAISDLAAMGAAPLGVLAALVLPDDVSDDHLARLADGQRQAAEQAGTAIIGGNLAGGAELSITTTVLGSAVRPIRRDGARAGDVVWLAGDVGLAGAGLLLLQSEATGERDRARRTAAGETAAAAFLRPRPRIAEGLAARAVASAAIDVSDGLARDIGHIARATVGVRVVLDASSLVTPALAAVAAELGYDPLDLALHGGDDYALVVAAPSRAQLPGFRRIGALEAAEATEGSDALIWLASNEGALAAVPERGWDHFGNAR